MDKVKLSSAYGEQKKASTHYDFDTNLKILRIAFDDAIMTCEQYASRNGKDYEIAYQRGMQDVLLVLKEMLNGF